MFSTFSTELSTIIGALRLFHCGKLLNVHKVIPGQGDLQFKIKSVTVVQCDKRRIYFRSNTSRLFKFRSDMYGSNSVRIVLDKNRKHDKLKELFLRQFYTSRGRAVGSSSGS